MQRLDMTTRLVACALLLAATGCSSANRNAGASAAPVTIVKNESSSTLELYIAEGANGGNRRRVTKLAPSESYRYRGPTAGSCFVAAIVGSGVATEQHAWVSCNPSGVGSVTCK
jgi:hypothetical protein